tara:strand:- start:3637 stop:4119 length:483 start_codon:yes stop_codon:yes gene_type:complete
MASTGQDLSDLAELVLTKLREGDGPAAHPVIVHIYAEMHGSSFPETHTKMQRVWVDGLVHWGFQDTLLTHQSLSKALPAMRNARTAIRLALGRAHAASTTRSSDWIRVKMFVYTGNLKSMVFSALVDSKTRLVTLKDELEMVRILQEIECVRMVPTRVAK